MKRLLAVLIILSGLGWAQNTPTIGVLPDNGPALPATCTVGQIYFKTTATTALNACLSANTWTSLGAGGGLPAGLTFVVPTLTVSTAGSGNGQIALSGNTSGTATMTAPAVAGTATNAITFSNVIQPVGGMSFTAGSAPAGTTGIYNTASSNVVINSAGQSDITLTSTVIELDRNVTMGVTGHVLIGNVAPTIAAGGCGGAAASIPSNNGTAAFTINVGTTPTSGGCTITLPAATTDWVCHCRDLTTKSTTVSSCEQSNAASTNSAVLQIFSDVAVAAAPVASDILRVSCFAY